MQGRPADPCTHRRRAAEAVAKAEAEAAATAVAAAAATGPPAPSTGGPVAAVAAPPAAVPPAAASPSPGGVEAGAVLAGRASPTEEAVLRRVLDGPVCPTNPALAALWREKNTKTPLQDKTTGMDMDTTAAPAPASSNTGLQVGDRVLLLAASELGVAAEAVVKAVGKGSVLIMGMPYKVQKNHVGIGDLVLKANPAIDDSSKMKKGEKAAQEKGVSAAKNITFWESMPEFKLSKGVSNLWGLRGSLTGLVISVPAKRVRKL